MAGSKKLKQQILITSNGLDFPRGFAPNAQGKELGQALIDMGYDPLLIPQKLSSFPDEASQGSYFGIRYDYLANSRKSMGSQSGSFFRKVGGALYSVVAAFRLARYLVRNRTRVAAVFDLSNQTFPLMIEGIACRLLGIPLVYFVWEEVCSHRINRQNSLGLRWMHRMISFIEAPLLYGVAMRFPTRLTYLTEASHLFLRKWGYGERVLLDFPVVKYRSSMASESSEITKGKSNGTGLDLVFTGTINTEKDDFFSVIGAIATLKDKYPLLRLKIYGNTEGGAKEAIERVAEQHDVADRVEFMGWFKLEDLDSVRRDSLALLVLKKDVSFNRYNFPSRVLDFIDSGRPLLISDLPSHRKYFSAGENAFIVKEGDVESLVSAIETAIEKPALTEAMTRKASHLLEKRFDATKNLRSLLETLQIKKSASSRRI